MPRERGGSCTVYCIPAVYLYTCIPVYLLYTCCIPAGAVVQCESAVYLYTAQNVYSQVYRTNPSGCAWSCVLGDNYRPTGHHIAPGTFTNQLGGSPLPSLHSYASIMPLEDLSTGPTTAALRWRYTAKYTGIQQVYRYTADSHCTTQPPQEYRRYTGI